MIRTIGHLALLVLLVVVLANVRPSEARSRGLVEDDGLDDRYAADAADDGYNDYKDDDYSSSDEGDMSIEVGHRLLGGSDALEGEFPYQISLKINGSHICGGSILTRWAILTAAHCVEGEVPSTMTIAAGSSYLHKPCNRRQERRVAKIYMHPLYRPRYHDISLLLLETPLKLNRDVQPVALPSPDEDPPEHSLLIISGWGRTSKEPVVTQPDALQWALLPYVSEEKCAQVYQEMPFFNPGSICAGHLESMHIDTCQGDSGGPLTMYKNGRHVQVGVVAWGPEDCATPGYPGVYTKVSYYLDWMRGRDH